ncbi:MAG: histidine phosphatase family protein [Clostridia bacterium]|nr:histidine phosphatase family protein [Clostridia bacterium]
MRIIFVRHGEPDYARDCLTEAGHSQGRAAAERLRSEGITHIFSSPMGRAMETAEYTADALGLPIQVLDFMHEIRWGSADGTRLFADGHPWDTANELIRRGVDLADPGWMAHPVFQGNLLLTEVPRVGDATDAWLEEMGYVRQGAAYRCVREQRATAALFCHGGSSTAALARMLHLPFPYLCAAVHLCFAGSLTLRLDSRPGSVCLPILEAVWDDPDLG